MAYNEARQLRATCVRQENVMANDRELYALEKLGEALHELVTHPGRVQERLGEAFTFLVRIRPGELPAGELRQLLIGIKDDLTFEQAKGKEGRLGATLLGLSDEDASAIAARILRLYEGLGELLDGKDPNG
jgi:hypothetical protein